MQTADRPDPSERPERALPSHAAMDQFAVRDGELVIGSS